MSIEAWGDENPDYVDMEWAYEAGWLNPDQAGDLRAELEQTKLELAREREKFIMHTAEVGAWLSLLTATFGVTADNVRDACSKVIDAATLMQQRQK